MPITPKKILCCILLFVCCLLTNCATRLNLAALQTGAYANPTEQSAPASEDELLIYIIDVGQGDATLILGPERDGGRVSLLIDAGGLDPDGGTIVANVLQELAVTQLDYLVLTHFDADHMGGLVTIRDTTSILWDEDCTPRETFPTQAIIDLGSTSNTTDSVTQYTACRDANVSLLQVDHLVVGATPSENIGYTMDLAGHYTASVVAGNGYVIDQVDVVPHVDTDNERSIAILVSGPDDFNFLVTGDLTGIVYGTEDAEVEPVLGDALQARGIDLSILRVGHHGSATSSAPEFLQSLQPEVAIISVGDNTYGHPNCGTLANLNEVSGLILQTESGLVANCAEPTSDVVANDSIRISVKGSSYTISSTGQSYQSVLGDAVFTYVCTVDAGCVQL